MYFLETKAPARNADPITLAFFMAPWHHSAVAPWYHGTMVPWYHGTMVPCQDNRLLGRGKNMLMLLSEFGQIMAQMLRGHQNKDLGASLGAK